LELANTGEPLCDTFFKSRALIFAQYATKPLLQAADARAALDAARTTYVARAQLLTRGSSSWRTGAVAQALEAAKKAAEKTQLQPAYAPFDAAWQRSFDVVCRDARTPQGAQIFRLCSLIAAQSDIEPQDIVGFIDQFSAAMAERYHITVALDLRLLNQMCARAIYPLIRANCATVLHRTLASALPDYTAYQRGLEYWRSQTGTALGVDMQLWNSLLNAKQIDLGNEAEEDDYHLLVDCESLLSNASSSSSTSSSSSSARCLLPKATRLLRRVTTFSTPIDMLYIVKSTISVICEEVANNSSAVVGADELFPLVVHVVAHARILRLPTLVSFMDEFAGNADRSSEFGYCLTTLAAAVHHVTNQRNQQ